MSNDISDKDRKDWEDFVSSKQKLFDKDHKKQTKTYDAIPKHLNIIQPSETFTHNTGCIWASARWLIYVDMLLEKYGTQQELLDYSGLNYNILSRKMKNFIKE